MIAMIDSPFWILPFMARGIDKPTINKKIGKMISANPVPSKSAGLCSNHEGISCNDQRSLTKIINNIVSALKISIAGRRKCGLLSNGFTIMVYFIGSTTNLMKVPFEPEVRRW
jgi:hypothetical protein